MLNQSEFPSLDFLVVNVSWAFTPILAMFQDDKFDYRITCVPQIHLASVFPRRSFAWQVIKAVKRWSFPLDGPRPGKYMNQARMGQKFYCFAWLDRVDLIAGSWRPVLLCAR